jgi:hypothetical protein
MRGLTAALVLMSLSGCLEDNKSSLASGRTPAALVSGKSHVTGEKPGLGRGPVKQPQPPGGGDPVTQPPPTTPVETSPEIAGTPSLFAKVGQAYEFVPTATDADGDALTFSVSGKPPWASFDSSTGRLSGKPAVGDAGTRSSVSISVSDGKNTATLPFSLAVTGDHKAAHYGHYFATRATDEPDDVAMLCDQPGVSGVVWRRTWKEVEPAAGTYDFSSFDEVLAAIAGSHNPQCQLWILVEWKSFAGSPIKNPCPTYLQDRSALIAGGAGTSVCFMWEPAVLKAYIAMIKAAASRYDANPRVEGLIFQESALSLYGDNSQDVADGGTYTAEAWRDALIAMVGACGAAFQQSHCVAFLNFIRHGQKYLYNVSAALAALPDDRGCMSGPDVLPDNTSLYQNTASAYQVLVRHDGCRSNSVQNDSFEVPGCGMDCIFRFAVSGNYGVFDASAPRSSGLCVNSYLFWNHRVMVSSTGLDWHDALPVIAAYPYGSGWTDHCDGGGGPL